MRRARVALAARALAARVPGGLGALAVLGALGVLAVLAAVGAGAACAEPATGKPKEKRMADASVVRSEDELKAHDGETVVLVGTYARRLVPKKMGGPLVDVGQAMVKIGETKIRLGTEPRPAEERSRFDGKQVRVRGTLRMKPPLDQPEHVAQPLPPPTLFDPGPIEPAE